MRSVVVKLVMYSMIESDIALGRFVASYASDGAAGGTSGTAKDTEGQKGRECTRGH